MGIALSRTREGASQRHSGNSDDRARQHKDNRRTFMKDVAHRAIIHNHNLAQIRFDRANILDIRAIPIRAMLAVVSTAEELSVLL